MPYTMRVSRPGYNCLTDGTIDHYSIYADSDNILIKEFTRGGTTLSAGAIGTITHNLGYIPDFKVYVNDLTGSFPPNGWKQVGQANISAVFLTASDTTKIIIENDSGTATAFKYYVFYDQQL